MHPTGGGWGENLQQLSTLHEPRVHTPSGLSKTSEETVVVISVFLVWPKGRFINHIVLKGRFKLVMTSVTFSVAARVGRVKCFDSV